MPLERSTHSEKIVAAAVKLFARQGYHGTSTRGIARLAGVSENTIFRQFNHKENVFWSALRTEAESLKMRWEHLMTGVTESDSPEIVLPEILTFLTETINAKPEMLRLFGIALLELQADAEKVCSDLIEPVFSELCTYLAMSIKKGQVLKVDPTLLTAALMSMVLAFPQFSKLRGKSAPPYESDNEAILAQSKFWLDLVSPGSPARTAVFLASETQSST
jgi:AcrR family transcriptional regulator